ncbi:MAG: response regulator, partial [Anaerolineales bacterium]|nr:response regulator [Anaerolineales bacterium]
NRLVLRQLLARIGFAVREADSGAAGVALAAAHPPDVVLLDLRMPEMDGFETAAALRRLPALADSCIIAVSAIAEQPEIDRSLASGCDAFLAKPVQAAALLALLADHLQLTWQLADRVAETAVAPQPAPPAFLPPPPGDVQTLLDLARRGHLRGIHEHAAALAEQDTRYRPFAARLIALATAYDEAEILKLLEQFA